MPNIVRLAVDNPEELLNAGAYGAGAITRVESSVASTGPFASVGTAPIVAGTRSYTVYDVNGTTTTWYRTRYENAGGSVLSAYSDPFNVGGVGIVELAEVKIALGKAVTDTKDDEDLLDRISDVTDWIEGTTGRRFRPDPTPTYFFDGYSALENGRLLPIPQGFQNVTQVQIAMYTGGPFVTLPLGDVFPRPVQRDPGWPYTELWISDVPSSANTVPLFPGGHGNISVSANPFGWLTVPGAIHEVGMNLVIGSYRARAAGGAEQVRVGVSGERTYDRMLSYKDSRTINRYTVKVVEIV